MSVFKFKKFTIQQEKTAMKVGTDAVLLGSWCSLKNTPDTILDVGAGTGVISLIMAQRSKATTIDAVEIEENAYQQTVENFEASAWGDRLFCYHSSFQDFVSEMQEENEKYELIISNPPFYTDDFKTDDKARNNARFTIALSFEELLNGVSKLLSINGVFSTIIPFKEQEAFVKTASNNNLFVNRICNVKGNVLSKTKRSLLEFSFQKTEVKKEELVIETQRHQYTQDYINLTQDFYLKM